ncbi:MAG: ATP synthase F1 subunit epsilon [Planctomycetaceae bacterium]
MAKELRLVIVTPEKTLLDQEVESITVPMFDGQLGILPGRAPIVGRMGSGELRYRGGGSDASFFVDGGFLQIKEGIVSVLTNRSLTLDDIDVESAQTELSEAIARKSVTDEEFAARDKDIERARRMVSLAKKPR